MPVELASLNDYLTDPKQEQLWIHSAAPMQSLFHNRDLIMFSAGISTGKYRCSCNKLKCDWNVADIYLSGTQEKQ